MEIKRSGSRLPARDPPSISPVAYGSILSSIRPILPVLSEPWSRSSLVHAPRGIPIRWGKR